jgi:uncharacterized HAD superfamily protein
MEHKGLRLNNGKLRYDLVHPWSHEQMVKILTKGSIKYKERNWEDGMAWSNVIASLKRHLAAIEAGEDFDKETLELHAAHIACNAHFLTAYYKIYPQGDDRPLPYLNQKRVGLDIDGVLADFVGHLMKVSGNEGHIPNHWNDPIIKSEYENIKDDKEFWSTIPTLVDSKDIPFEPAAYITSRAIDVKVTQAWLDKNMFPTAPLYSIGHGMSKVETAQKAKIDLYVDDSYSNFVELNKAGILTYLYTTPYNVRYNVGARRIHNLKDLA